MVEESNNLKLLGWKPSLLIFLGTAFILRITHYVFVPAYQSTTGKPYLIGYLIGWVGTMFLVFAVSLVAYKQEGHPIHWMAFTTRYRLGRMYGIDWLWTLGMLLFAILSAAILSFTPKLLASFPIFAPHPAFPPEYINIANFIPGILFGMPL